MKNVKEKSGEGETLLDISELFPLFKKHLDIETNVRILFSGRFGIGKTYFLQKFFEKHADEYFYIHLHPTNYQIAGNEKIMEYIKTDILLSIFEQSGKKATKRANKIHKKILKSKWYQIAISTGKGFPVIKEFAKSVDEIIKAAGIITEECIKKELEKAGSGKKKVLIIDDLDRMDPAHIFRILNVFSSLVGEEEDRGTESKKLGFDQVICVCDLNNIKKIFSHIYGKETDFDGYINKYYSNDIYQYDGDEVEQVILKRLDRIVASFNVGESAKGYFTEENQKSNFYAYLIYRTLQLIFLTKNTHSNLRILFKAVNHKLPVLLEMQAHSNNVTKLNNTRIPDRRRMINMINKGINALKVIFGSKEILLDCIKEIIDACDNIIDEAHEVKKINSAFGGLLFATLIKKDLLRHESSEEEAEGVYTFAGSRYMLKERGNGHINLLPEGNSAILTVVLYKILLMYLENDLEKINY